MSIEQAAGLCAVTGDAAPQGVDPCASTADVARPGDWVALQPAVTGSLTGC
jgi:hypothetical protein